jgi:HEAT repeat protein
MHMARSEGLSREFRRALAIALIPRLSDEDPLVIAGATECVNALGRDGALALSRLRENVKSDRAEIRHASLRAIGALARDPARSVPVLTRALDHPDGETRVLAALALAQFGPDAAPASRRLADLAESGETRTALAAIQCLGRIGAPAGEGVVEPLGRALAKHPESLVRGASAVALGRIGLGAATAVPALAEALRDEESYVRGNAAQALARFGEEADAAVPDLVRALRDPVESIRVLAVEAIGEIGAPAAAAIPHLAVARDNNPSVMNGPVRAALNRIRRDGADGL